MKRGTIILLGFLTVWVGLGFILPAIASVRETGALPGAGLLPYTIGIVLAMGGAVVMGYGIALQRNTA